MSSDHQWHFQYNVCCTLDYEHGTDQPKDSLQLCMDSQPCILHNVFFLQGLGKAEGKPTTTSLHGGHHSPNLAGKHCSCPNLWKGQSLVPFWDSEGLFAGICGQRCGGRFLCETGGQVFCQLFTWMLELLSFSVKAWTLENQQSPLWHPPTRVFIRGPDLSRDLS